MSIATSHTALTPGQLVNWYRVEEVLGQGAFGITYLARDLNLDTEVALKEYFPSAWAVRLTPGSEVAPGGPGHARDFQWGLERFVSEGRILARFDHPSIVRVMSVFEANRTAYLVMRFERGAVLHDVLAHAEALTEDDLKTLLEPLLEGLRVLHAAGVIHRDIKPDNIFLRSDGAPLLLDFGAARQAMSGPTRELTAVGTAGYAPIEQYDSDEGRQGPWTDIYALGATLFHAVTGRPPENSLSRANAIVNSARDPLADVATRARGQFSSAFLRAIGHALAVRGDERPRDVEAFARELGITLDGADEVDGGAPTQVLAAAPRRAAPRTALTTPDMVDTGQWEIDGLQRAEDADARGTEHCAGPSAPTAQELAAAVHVAVGPANQAYYVKRLARPAGAPALSWNWAAALFTSAWLAYRKMYLWAFAIYPVLLATCLAAAWTIGGNVFPHDPRAQVEVLGASLAGLTLLAGLLGNHVYAREVRRWIDRTAALGLDGVEQRRWLRRKGGTSVVAAAVYVSLALALLGGGGWLGWRTLAGA